MKVSLKTVVVTVIITAVLFIGSVMFYRFCINAKPMGTVYRATRDILIGNTVHKSDLAARSINLTDFNSSYVSNLSEAVGKVVKQKIYKGEDVNAKRLADKSDPTLFISSNAKRFSIPTSYIDDPYSLTFRAGDVVDIIFTNTQTKTSKVVLPHAVVVGAIDQSGTTLNDDSTSLATAIIFQSTTNNILTITAGQYEGKFKFVKYPDNQ
jgi:Flp pilus assembly protein CpaB